MNPVKRVRKAMGMTVKEFAIATGVSYSVIYTTEAGLISQLHEPLREGMRSIGIDVAALAAEYVDWREFQRDAILRGKAKTG